MNELIRTLFSQSEGTHLDMYTRRELLERNINRIFAVQGAVWLWECEKQSHTIRENIIPSAEVFRETHMTRDLGSLGDCFFFVTQGHSWSRLQVPAELMLRIIVHHGIPPVLLDFIHCFGAKVTGEDNPFYGTFHSSISLEKGNGPNLRGQRYDFCCHIRRYEEHENDQMKDPWSLRQMTVHQRYDFESQRSTWVLIRPFRSCKPQLRALISDDRLHHPMSLNLFFLTMATENWRWYVDFLRKKLAEFSEKAIFSSFDSVKVNYDIKFADSQRLHALESKTTIALAVLEQNIAIGIGMKKHCQSLERVHHLTLDRGSIPVVKDGIDMQLAQLKIHRRSCELLLQQLRGTCALLIKVLDCRNELIMRDHSKLAIELARTSNAQNHSLNLAAQEAKRESRTMKVLTFIAMAYLPASLIASVFSSGLIHTSDQNMSTDSFRISKDMWIFVLSSVGVTFVTISTAFWFAQYGQ